jgi:hypothetical protein
MLRIIEEQCEKLFAPFEGYNEVVLETVFDILELERRHRISPTNIQQQILQRLEFLGNRIEDRSTTEI